MAVKMLLLVLTFTFSLQTIANDKLIKELMNNYLKGLHSQDRSLLKNITSNNYFKGLDKNFLQKKVKQNKKFIPFGFDIQVNKANIKKGQYWVNIKDKKQIEYSDYWYIIEKEKNLYKITNMVHSED